MFKWVNNISEYFSFHQLKKDLDNEGNLHGFYRACAEIVDEYLSHIVYNLLERIYFPATAEPEYFEYIEADYKLPINFTDDLAIKREFLKHLPLINRIRGTKSSYEVMLRMLGFSGVHLEEIWDNGGFDSPITLDDGFRRLDSGGCQECSLYHIHLCGDIPLSDALWVSIQETIEFLEPINAQLGRITYRGQDTDEMIYFRIINGNLVMFEFGVSNHDEFYIKDGDLYVQQDGSGIYNINNTYLFKELDFVNAPSYIVNTLNEWELLYPDRTLCQLPRIREHEITLYSNAEHTQLHDLKNDYLLVRLVNTDNSLFTQYTVKELHENYIKVITPSSFTGKILIIG